MEEALLHKFFATLQSHFLKGEVAQLEDFFSFPLVVYTPAGVLVIQGRDEFATLTQQYRAALTALDVVETKVEIDTQETSSADRRQVTVRFHDMSADGLVVTGSLIRYFLVEKSKKLRIEMMEYLESPLPKSDVERIIH